MNINRRGLIGGAVAGLCAACVKPVRAAKEALCLYHYERETTPWFCLTDSEAEKMGLRRLEHCLKEFYPGCIASSASSIRPTVGELRLSYSTVLGLRRCRELFSWTSTALVRRSGELHWSGRFMAFSNGAIYSDVCEETEIREFVELAREESERGKYFASHDMAMAMMNEIVVLVGDDPGEVHRKILAQHLQLEKIRSSRGDRNFLLATYPKVTFFSAAQWTDELRKLSLLCGCEVVT